MKKSLTAVKQHLRANWFFLLVMLICTIALFLQIHQVVLYADDYLYGQYSSGGLPAAIARFQEDYLKWGGQYLHIFVILFLGAHPLVWQIFFTLLFVIFVWLATKLICHQHPERKGLIATLLWSCIFLLSIWVSREAVFWVSGAMNYLFPMFEAFIFFYFFYTRLFQQIHRPYDVVVLPLTAFLSGWSSAQGGVISLCIAVFLILWQRLIQKKPVAKLYYISTLFSLIGFCIYFFAPGNHARLKQGFPEYASLGLFDKITYRLKDVTWPLFNSVGFGVTCAPFFLYFAVGLISLLDLPNLKTAKPKFLQLLRFFSIVYSLLFILCFVISFLGITNISPLFQRAFTYVDLYATIQQGTFSPHYLLPYFAAFLFIISSLVSAFFVAKQQRNPLAFVMLLTAYIAEFSLILSPYNPLRTNFYPICCLWLVIAYSFLTAHQAKINIFPIAIALIALLSPSLSLVFLVCYLILLGFKSTPTSSVSYLFVTFLALLSVLNYGQIFVGYRDNRVINGHNLSLIQSASSSHPATPADFLYDFSDPVPTTSAITLQQPCDQTYMFDSGDKLWQEYTVHKYFNLSPSVDLQYEETPSGTCRHFPDNTP